MSKKLRPLIVFLILAVLAVVIAGCAERGAKSTPTKQVLTSYLNEPAFIDPYNGQESEGVEVIANVFDGLVDFDSKTSEIKPAVAESWTSNKEGTVWTFKLRQGTKFHNGREVVAEDFKYAWDRIANPKQDPPSDISYHLASIKGFDEVQAGKATELSGVKAKDKYTLEVTLNYPFADFIYVVGHPSLAPVPKEEVEKDPKKFAEKPVGNGPFMMSEPWKHNQSIKLKRFAGYYGDKAKLDEIVFKIYKDDQTAYLEFQAGKLDYTRAIPTGQIQQAVKKYGQSEDGYESKPGKQVLLGTEAAVYYLNPNNADEVLKNPDVRRAISMAIDREAITKTIYEGTRQPASGIIPPGVVGFQKDAGKYSVFNQTEAKKLLEKAGYPNGKGLPTLQLAYNTESTDHKDVMEAVRGNLEAIGIKAELQGFEWAKFVDYRQQGEHKLARDGWTFDYPVMDNVLYSLFMGSNIGKDNTSRYNNSDFDKTVVAARKEVDPDKRIELYRKAEKMILDDAGVIPIAFYAHRAVAQEWVKGLVLSPMYITYYDKVSIEK